MIALLLLLLSPLQHAETDTLTLAQSYAYAEEAHPLRQQLSLQHEIASLRVENLNVSYLPALAIRSQAVYHSDVAEIQTPLAGSSTIQPSQDQYKVSVGLDQLVYDGGVTAQLKALEQVQRDLLTGKVEVELYKLKEQVTTAYFAILFLDAQIENLDLMDSDLAAKQRTLESAVANGTGLQDNVDVIAAERISVEQRRIENVADKQAALRILQELLGRPLAPDVVLELPDLGETPTPLERDRPEYLVFDAGRKILDESASLERLRLRPRISAFAEAAVGRPPGLNFFETDFKPFYSAGLRLTWNPWNWQSTRRTRRIQSLEADVIDAEERSFSRQIRISVQRDLGDIDKFRSLLDSDAEAVRLRERIAERAGSKLANGVVTASEYLTERNAASRARLLQRIHEIQFAQAKARYLTTIGN
ncbi:MAG: TolC family protein [Rhodothermales bacterium]|nr:TolC family protein [Rhodothermales bacterium]